MQSKPLVFVWHGAQELRTIAVASTENEVRYVFSDPDFACLRQCNSLHRTIRSFVLLPPKLPTLVIAVTSYTTRHLGHPQSTHYIFPRKLFKWFCSTLLALCASLRRDEWYGNSNKRCCGLASCGAWIAVPTTVLCTATSLFIIVYGSPEKAVTEGGDDRCSRGVIATSLGLCSTCEIGMRQQARNRLPDILAQYAAQLKPGMTREQVERHLD